MSGKLSKIVNLVRNMGIRYTVYRAYYELMMRSGLQRKKFPVAPRYQQYLTLEQWKKGKPVFFFGSREELRFPANPTGALKENFDLIRSGKLMMFHSFTADLGAEYDWMTNPDSGFRYDRKKHWTEIPDLSKEAGDIKFVWEKSRFSYLYDIIRYDYHFKEDSAAVVFRDMLSWIDANPVNCGPNYRCSQEISLRVLNWTFALHYYRNSPLLTDEVFNQIQYAIYWQMDHVFKNIHFSRIAVRNNHAITESLALYLAGLLYPGLPGAAEWKAKGKIWFEKEIAYQIYEDGTYLQFSMNYHRIVVQLLTWAIALSEKNGERFSNTVYDRARKSVVFLRTCLVDETGWLPNYGANDGALFFKLTDGHFRDYRPQLQALAALLGIDLGFGSCCEDTMWYGIPANGSEYWAPESGGHSFSIGGYYMIRELEALTFIKCGSYKDRPSHADNLHLDIWYKGENILPDAGSYKYNTDEATMRYFSGTASHNTVMLDDKDQMLKGGRFIWYYWTKKKTVEMTEHADSFGFAGSVFAFGHVKAGIVHTRQVIKKKGAPLWEITDSVSGAPEGMVMNQLWHMPRSLTSKATIAATKSNGEILTVQVRDGWYSCLYGRKEQITELFFSTPDRSIKTTITVETQ